MPQSGAMVDKLLRIGPFRHLFMSPSGHRAIGRRRFAAPTSDLGHARGKNRGGNEVKAELAA